MMSVRRQDDERPGALFWLGIFVAALFMVRLLAKELEAPMVLRLLLGLTLISALVVMAGVFAVGRLRGGVVGVRAVVGVWGVAVFLIGFAWLLNDRGPLVTVIVGLTALAAVGAALAASFWD